MYSIINIIKHLFVYTEMMGFNCLHRVAAREGEI
jgi:hypothetical protein